MTGEQNFLFHESDSVRHGTARRRNHLILGKLLADKARDARLHDEAQQRAFSIFAKWAKLESAKRLAKMSEATLRGEFLSEIFGQALGYALPTRGLPQWDLQAEFAVPGGRADAAIGRFSSDSSNLRAIVELKGPTVNIDRDRSGGRTAVQQLWDYLIAVPGCPWGIVCNYVGFRLYHRQKTPYAFEHFALAELQRLETFRQFWVLFERGGLLPLAPGQRPRADELLEQSEERQREVGSKLYEDYHQNRMAMIQHFRREPYGKSLDQAIGIAQKLLDRVIFIAFCEDRALLPGSLIAKAWRDVPPFSNVTNPRWRNFKDLFRCIDKGNERAGIDAYNGGLFAHDDAVDSLELDDQFASFFREVGEYDFREEINVDVLGHLFEQSVTDLEAFRAEANGNEQPEAEEPGRRKREGIYYTPPRITDYIIHETLGQWLEDRTAPLAREFGLDGGRGNEADPKIWLEFQSRRLEIVRALRVCDPACGSGAFLIRAYDFLENIYEEIITTLAEGDEAKERSLRNEMPDWILRGNLFGVDLSAEAVEITQLALWIRSARRGRTLADLSANIQWGNSLVDDPEVDTRAFDWPKRFPEVFAQGKFHCVIANPPYVKLQNFRKHEPRVAKYLVERFRSARTGNFDMYLPFIERGLDLLAPDGRMGYIAPSVWLFNEYGQGLRELLAERKALEKFVDFKSHQVFPDATTYTALQFFSASPQKRIKVADAGSGDLEELNFYEVSYARRGGEAWALLGETEQKIIDTMREGSTTLADATEQIFQGLITSADAVYHLIKTGPGRYFSKALSTEVELDEQIMKPLVSGEDAVPFATPTTEKYLLFPYLVTQEECRLFTAKEMAKQFKRTWAYLRKNEKALRARESGKFDVDEGWWQFGRNQSIDKQEHPKLLVPRLLHQLFAGADPNGQVYLDNVDVGGVLIHQRWNIYYVLGVLNSRACNFAWRKNSKPFRGEYRSANKQFIAPLPIPQPKSQKPVADLARKLHELHGMRLAAESRVHRRFVVDLTPSEKRSSTAPPPNLPGFLQTFAERPTGAVIDALQKYAKRRFKPPERQAWDEYLTAESAAVVKIKTEIADREAELNDRVFKIYGLDPDQIKFIEGE